MGALLTYRPDYTWKIAYPPKDNAEAFNQRFLLLTPENTAEVAARFPELFGG